MKAAIFGILVTAGFISLQAQFHDPPDQGEPGDRMIQAYLRTATEKIEADALGDIHSAAEWEQRRPEYEREYYEMLGLWPKPEKTPLEARVTGTLDRGEYKVEMVAYQSRPGLYVTGNLYRPATLEGGKKYPAIFYVCGHSSRGRNGGKTAFQSHGIWFARHGYVCLIVDTLQLGEIAGIHHGTYREGRWWWVSRGYTPAGVECWNGIRGIDYLLTRPEVDPKRIGVTGISGGGAATFWIAAADERVAAAVPVSGMADLVSYVPHRVVNGHCDCMFLYNAYQWPWTRIAALIAPRPLLFVNSDHDEIFPMDANDRVINRLERVYSWFGAGDQVDSFVSMGGHAYRADIRRGSFRFMNIHLKNDPGAVLDSEVDLVTGPREEVHPIPPEKLRVFPSNSDIPADAINKRVDEVFVLMAKPLAPAAGEFEAWKRKLLSDLKRLTFHHFPESIPPVQGAREIRMGRGQPEGGGVLQLETEPGIFIRVRRVRQPEEAARVILVTSAKLQDDIPEWISSKAGPRDAIFICEPRGFGLSRWTQKNPPNYVERSLYLLGRTADSGRIWDLAATAGWLRIKAGANVPVVAAGEGGLGILGVYAGLLTGDISGVWMKNPPASHMNSEAPVLLNVLRVCDIPEAIGMLAPRLATIVGARPDGELGRARQIYEAAGASQRITYE